MTGGSMKKWKIENPVKDPRLASYLKEVNLWHGYIKYLGLPQLSDLKDTPIQNLFVLPKIASSWISADRQVSAWPERHSVLEVLSLHKFLVILGEPGGGKSTLLNWLAWRLAGGKYPKEIGPLIPFPIVLRDLDLSGLKNWNDLLSAFLCHPMASVLAENRDLVEEVLNSGQAIVLIDGIDEISNLEVRKRLRSSVYEGRGKYPKIKWVLTSRIVGYDELPFEDDQRSAGQKNAESIALRHGADNDSLNFSAAESLFYVCPFDDKQISEFCANWYALRERSKADAQSKAGDLVKALKEDGSTLRLARTPNLLTMMALLHRVKARLPHGRTLLYEDIAHAYLHTIDDYRKLHVGENYPLQHKKRWLARVAWELQARRSLNESSNKGSILASKEELLNWFSESMAESGVSDPRNSALEFLDYIAKRSGLLIPRSEASFAFLHLSFQEYFCSIYVLDQFEASIFGSPNSLNHKILKKWISMPIWAEVIVFLFELGSLKASHWSGWLLEKSFGKNFSRVPNFKTESKSGALFELMYKILSNPHVGLTAENRVAGLDSLIDNYFKGYEYISFYWLDDICKEYSGFYSEEEIIEKFWISFKRHDLKWMEFRDKDLNYIRKLAPWDGVLTLYTDANIDERSIVQMFPGLSDIFLGGKVITDTEAINNLRNLKALGVIDLDMLRKLDVSLLKGLTDVLIGCDLSDDYTPVPLDSVTGISLRGKVKTFEFIGGKLLKSLRFINCEVHSFEGLDAFKGLNELRFISSSFVGVGSEDIPSNIRTVHGDKELISGFPEDLWEVMHYERRSSKAVRKRRRRSA